MGKLGLKLVFWKNISSHTHAFLLLIFNALRYVFKNQVILLKRCFFQIFDWSNLIFDQSKSFWKILVSLCLVWLIEPIFRSIEHRESSFFKNSYLTCSSTFSKLFSNFPLSLWLGKAPLRIFCRFPSNLSQGFPLPKPISPFYPSFCILFYDFMHKLMHFNGIFGTFHIWDFCWINPLFLKLIIAFCSYIVIFMIYVG